MSRSFRLAAAFAISLCLMLACGPPDKRDILKKAEGAKTRQDLEMALGDPDEVDKLGPVETWTYEASNGSVEFLITGDTVALQSTRDAEEEEEEE